MAGATLSSNIAMPPLPGNIDKTAGARKQYAISKAQDKLLPGTLDMLVLKALCHGRMHGYGIAKRIKQLSYDALTVEEGSLYPALFRLSRQGYVNSEWAVTENNQSARFYTLTAAGRRQLERETESWERLATGVMRVLQSV